MKWTSLDRIVRSILASKGYPKHYYFQYMKLSLDIFRELHFDTLRVVNAKRLPVSKTGAVTLPCDYVDFTKVGIAIGQMVYPLVQRKGINRLQAVDANGQLTTYGEGTGAIQVSRWVEGDYNDNGEDVGRQYGATAAGADADTIKIILERNEIQLHESIVCDEIILEYISDGTYCNAATKVHPYAQACIEAYAKWKATPNADNIYSPEAKTFAAEWRKLRARMNPLTMSDIRRIVNRGKTATIK